VKESSREGCVGMEGVRVFMRERIFVTREGTSIMWSGRSVVPARKTPELCDIGKNKAMWRTLA